MAKTPFRSAVEDSAPALTPPETPKAKASQAPAAEKTDATPVQVTKDTVTTESKTPPKTNDQLAVESLKAAVIRLLAGTPHDLATFSSSCTAEQRHEYHASRANARAVLEWWCL